MLVCVRIFERKIVLSPVKTIGYFGLDILILSQLTTLCYSYFIILLHDKELGSLVFPFLWQKFLSKSVLGRIGCNELNAQNCLISFSSIWYVEALYFVQDLIIFP